MARGGFIAPKVYLQRAFGRNLSLEQAKEAVFEAAQLGKLNLKGRRSVSAISRLGADPNALGKAEPKPQAQNIPPHVWVGLSWEEFATWDWDSGRFHGNGELGLDTWEAVKFNEAEANALLSRLAARHSPAQSESRIPQVSERRRAPTWDEWVAAVATLAYEHQIDVNSSDKDILDRAVGRLGRDFEVNKRMESAAQAIVRRWKSIPPKEPPPKLLKFEDPTSKR